MGTSPVVQWLRLCFPNAGGLGSIPCQGTKIPHPATTEPQLGKPEYSKEDPSQPQ